MSAGLALTPWQRAELAIHEAGHAAASVLLLGWPLRKVTIVPREDRSRREGWVWGCVSYRPRRVRLPPADDVEGQRRDAEGRAIAHLAGIAANTLATGDADALTGRLYLLRRRRDYRLHELLVARRELEAHWPAGEVDQVWQRVWGDVLACLRFPPTWAAVLALANALDLRGTVDGPEAEELLLETEAGVRARIEETLDALDRPTTDRPALTQRFRGLLAAAPLVLALLALPACDMATEPCPVTYRGAAVDDAGDETGEVLVGFCAVPLPPRIP